MKNTHMYTHMPTHPWFCFVWQNQQFLISKVKHAWWAHMWLIDVQCQVQETSLRCRGFISGTRKRTALGYRLRSAREPPEHQNLQKGSPGDPGLDELCLAEQRNNMQQPQGPWVSEPDRPLFSKISMTTFPGENESCQHFHEALLPSHTPMMTCSLPHSDLKNSHKSDGYRATAAPSNKHFCTWSLP